jgi:succinoglycan biosynthesis protein ExoA
VDPLVGTGDLGVSVIMPVLDEELHLREAVERVLDQDWNGPLEVVLALGPSADATDAIAADLAAADPRVRTVPNPSGRTAAGLNAAIAASVHPVVVRVDGHALFPRDYLSTAVRVLIETGADNVGGIMAAEGSTTFERAVACAMRSPLGVGAASFHTGGEPGEAPTVYLGSFRRSALERVGGYDERFIRSQDWELNHRIRTSGGVVWFTPQMHVTYRPRPDVRRLARQYLEYGRWRRAVMRRHDGTASARYLAPPAALITVALGTVIGLSGRPIGWLAPLGYVAGVTLGGVWIARKESAAVQFRMPVVLATMHGSWAWGFLTSRERVGGIIEGDADGGNG